MDKSPRQNTFCKSLGMDNVLIFWLRGHPNSTASAIFLEDSRRVYISGGVYFLTCVVAVAYESHYTLPKRREARKKYRLQKDDE